LSERAKGATLERGGLSGQEWSDMTAALEGKHVVVTGGTGALGTAVVARLL